MRTRMRRSYVKIHMRPGGCSKHGIYWPLSPCLAIQHGHFARVRAWPLDELVDEVLDMASHNNWLRLDATPSWALQLMIADTHNDWWLFRRLPTSRRTGAAVSCRTPAGIPSV